MKEPKNPLTPEQQLEAWRLLMAGGDNTDADIAAKMNLKPSHVSVCLAVMEKKKMDRINQQVNERYENQKAHDRQQTEASKTVQNITGRPNRILDRNTKRVKIRQTVL